MTDGTAAPSEHETLLDVDNIVLRFGGVTAIDGVSFSVRPQELFAVIGPNGAGKTSVFNSISQVYRPQEGDIPLGGQRRSAATSLGVHEPSWTGKLNRPCSSRASDSRWRGGRAMRAAATAAAMGSSRPPRSTSTASVTLAGRP